MMSENIN